MVTPQSPPALTGLTKRPFNNPIKYLYDFSGSLCMSSAVDCYDVATGDAVATDLALSDPRRCGMWVGEQVYEWIRGD